MASSDRIFGFLNAASRTASAGAGLYNQIQEKEAQAILDMKMPELDKMTNQAVEKLRQKDAAGNWQGVESWVDSWDKGVISGQGLGAAGQSLYDAETNPDALIGEISNPLARRALEQAWLKKKEAVRTHLQESKDNYLRDNARIGHQVAITEALNNDTLGMEQTAAIVSDNLTKIRDLVSPDDYQKLSDSYKAIVINDGLRSAGLAAIAAAEKDGKTGLLSLESMRAAVNSLSSVTFQGKAVAITDETRKRVAAELTNEITEKRAINEAIRSDEARALSDDFFTSYLNPNYTSLGSTKAASGATLPGLYAIRDMLKSSDPAVNKYAKYGANANGLLDQTEARIQALLAQEKVATAEGYAALKTKTTDLFQSEVYNMIHSGAPRDEVLSYIAKETAKAGVGQYIVDSAFAMEGTVHDWYKRAWDKDPVANTALAMIDKAFKGDPEKQKIATAYFMSGMGRGEAGRVLTSKDIDDMRENILKPHYEDKLENWTFAQQDRQYYAFGGEARHSDYVTAMTGNEKNAANQKIKAEEFRKRTGDAITALGFKNVMPNKQADGYTTYQTDKGLVYTYAGPEDQIMLALVAKDGSGVKQLGEAPIGKTAEQLGAEKAKAERAKDPVLGPVDKAIEEWPASLQTAMGDKKVALDIVKAKHGTAAYYAAGRKYGLISYEDILKAKDINDDVRFKIIDRPKKIENQTSTGGVR
jgi:hypothetical protein